jgi:hypothetical protein
MPSTLRYQVRQTTIGGVTTWWVHDTLTDQRVTPAMEDKRQEVKGMNVLIRPAAKQRVRKIAKRMNHRERNDLA